MENLSPRTKPFDLQFTPETIKLLDKIAFIVIKKIALKASEISKENFITTEDIIAALSLCGLGNYMKIFYNFIQNVEDDPSPKHSSSAFKDKVYEVVSKIPKGKVMTYKEVAIAAGNPGGSRDRKSVV